jgi:hypothetical protein
MKLNHTLEINGNVYLKGETLTKEDEADLKKSGTKVTKLIEPKKEDAKK